MYQNYGGTPPTVYRNSTVNDISTGEFTQPLLIQPQRQVYTPRPYQQQLIEQVFSSWSKGSRRVVMQLPTGGGKTPTFCFIAERFLKEGMGILILAHRKELIDQAHEKVEVITGLPAGFIKAGRPINWDYDIQVASVQTLTRRKTYPDVGLIVVDECHHACSKSYTRIFEAYPNAYILGVTATPHRGDGQSLKRWFDDLIVGPTVRELIEMGNLSDYRLYAASSQINTGGVKTTGGDFNLNQLADAIDTSLVAGNIVETWRQYADGTQTVVFNVDVKHSIEATEAFEADGIKAAHIHGKTTDTLRSDLIRRFRDKEITVLSNCGIFTEGFDCPGIETIQCVRPTRSLILWLQMLGRALRPLPGKKYARIIDHSENWKYLGLPDDEREWSLEPISLGGAKYAQQCPDCNHVFRPLPHETAKPKRVELDAQGKQVFLYECECPSCLTSFEFELGTGSEGGERILQQDEDAQFSEVHLQVQDWAVEVFSEFKQVQESTHKKPGWVYYRLLEHERVSEFTLGDWRYFASKLGYKPGWAWYKWNECQQQKQSSDHLAA